MESENNQSKSEEESLIINRVVAETQKIKEELEKLNAHKLVQTYNSLPKLLFFLFLKGVAFGLGTFVGATIVVSVLIYLVSLVEFVPVIGEWISLIVQEVQGDNP